MKTLAVIAAIAAILLTLLLPVSARAKAHGDTIGAYTKETPTGTSRADMAEATSTPPTITKTGAAVATTTATTTEKLTKSEERAKIRALKAEIKRLMKLIEELKKRV